MTFYRMTDAGREERPTLSLFPTGQFMTPVLYSQSEATLVQLSRRSHFVINGDDPPVGCTQRVPHRQVPAGEAQPE